MKIWKICEFLVKFGENLKNWTNIGESWVKNGMGGLHMIKHDFFKNYHSVRWGPILAAATIQQYRASRTNQFLRWNNKMESARQYFIAQKVSKSSTLVYIYKQAWVKKYDVFPSRKGSGDV